MQMMKYMLEIHLMNSKQLSEYWYKFAKIQNAMRTLNNQQTSQQKNQTNEPVKKPNHTNKKKKTKK